MVEKTVAVIHMYMQQCVYHHHHHQEKVKITTTDIIINCNGLGICILFVTFDVSYLFLHFHSLIQNQGMEKYKHAMPANGTNKVIFY